MKKADRVRDVARAESTHALTYQDYLRLPSGRRYELIEGELRMPPSPNTAHQRFTLKLAVALREWVTKRCMGEVFIAPYDVVLSEKNVVQPDIIFVSRSRANQITTANILGAPDLVVEVLSPSDQNVDRIKKRQLYGRFGVLEYWIVDPDGPTVERISYGDSGEETVGTFRSGDVVASEVLPGFSLSVSELP